MNEIPAIKIDDSCLTNHQAEALQAAMDLARWFHVNFDEKQQYRAALHEAAHAIYFQRLVGRLPAFFGPRISYESGKIHFATALVEVPPEDVLLTADVVGIAQFFMSASLITYRLLQGPVDTVVNECHQDFRLARRWYTRRVINDPVLAYKLDGHSLTEEILADRDLVLKWFHEQSEPGFHKLLADARESVLEDLNDEGFRRQLAERTHECQRKVFGTEFSDLGCLGA